MSVQERRARERAKLRSEILSAARELFVRDGYENFSMRKLAEKIEYSPTTIYLYFSDKADLLSQLCEDSFAKLVQQLETIASLTTDSVDGLRASMLAYVEFGLKNPSNYQAIFMLPDAMLAAKPGRRLAPEGAGMRVVDCLGRAVQDCMRKGKLRKADAEGTAQAIWAALHGIHFVAGGTSGVSVGPPRSTSGPSR
ncbi:MAG: TetR/AcrR family transcriptional regulator [Acidobacteria bacterium]|nr:TetR/AcrR family transcriptional regulator [Acidobacteriota bacterium]